MKKRLLSILTCSIVFATDTTQVTMADLKEATFLIIKDLKNTSQALDNMTARLDRMESLVNSSELKSSINDLRGSYLANKKLINELQSNLYKSKPISSRGYNYEHETVQKNINFNNNKRVETPKYKAPLSIDYDGSNYQGATQNSSISSNNNLSISYKAEPSTRSRSRSTSRYDEEILEFIESNGY